MSSSSWPYFQQALQISSESYCQRRLRHVNRGGHWPPHFLKWGQNSFSPPTFTTKTIVLRCILCILSTEKLIISKVFQTYALIIKSTNLVALYIVCDTNDEDLISNILLLIPARCQATLNFNVEKPTVA